ncbi:hypothetical protein CRG98_046309 [Punica granatum]|uniref:Uncharacterized protein n=1 Tax=Punica granatum TaxID=22663 RepID=A0A2I0HPA8_PUNGR|nr:hypothetical protein CRG98_046309 [Punica granatum]
MHEGKSRGSGLESRKTRLEATGEGPEGWQPRQSVKKRVGTRAPGTARCGAGLVGLLRGRSRRIRGKGSCARSVGPRTVTTYSRGRVRIVRNPLNVMARLAEVVGRNGMWLARCARLGGSRDPNVLTVGMGCRKLQIENLNPEMDLGGGKYVG